MPESFTGVPEEDAEVVVLLADVKGVLLVVTGFEVVLVPGLLLVNVVVLLLVVGFEVVLGLLVDLGVLTVVVMSLFKVLVVVLQVGLILLLEHNEVPVRVEVYVWPLLVDLLVQLHDVTVVCVVLVITVGAGIAAAKLRREANNSSRRSDNIFKERR